MANKTIQLPIPTTRINGDALPYGELVDAVVRVRYDAPAQGGTDFGYFPVAIPADPLTTEIPYEVTGVDVDRAIFVSFKVRTINPDDGVSTLDGVYGDVSTFTIVSATPEADGADTAAPIVS